MTSWQGFMLREKTGCEAMWWGELSNYLELIILINGDAIRDWSIGVKNVLDKFYELNALIGTGF